MSRIGLSIKEIPGVNDTQDLHLDASGNLVMVKDAEAIGEHCAQRLGTFKGEWFLDTEAGVPWLTDILANKYDPVLAETVTKAEIFDTDGVTEITSFSVKFDRETRNLTSHNISVVTIYDEEVEI